MCGCVDSIIRLRTYLDTEPSDIVGEEAIEAIWATQLGVIHCKVHGLCCTPLDTFAIHWVSDQSLSAVHRTDAFAEDRVPHLAIWTQQHALFSGGI